jgi:hypothetical protein
LEDLVNKTFAGLTLYYRDTTLSEDIANKYYKGQILLERAFADMSAAGRGWTGNFRYLIASAFGINIAKIDPAATKFGMAIINRNSYFKVLDIIKHEQNTQVLLLNIPEEGIDFFKNNNTNIEEEVIEAGRKSFDEKIKLPPSPTLLMKEWIERTSFPIGMNDSGVLYY